MGYEISSSVVKKLADERAYAIEVACVGSYSYINIVFRTTVYSFEDLAIRQLMIRIYNENVKNVKKWRCNM